MTDLDKIRHILEQERYTQGFNAVPVYLNRAGYSGIVMVQEIGVRYSGFVVRYQRGWAEYSYLVSDFERIWQTLKDRWRQDSSYFVGLKRAYDQRFARYDDLLRGDLGDRLSVSSDDEFMVLLDRARRAMIDVGISAHVTEAISWCADSELRQALGAQGLTGKQADALLAALTVPDTPSWAAQEQRSLDQLRSLNPNQQTRALEHHLDRWYWVHNSYAGRRQITTADLRHRLLEAPSADADQSSSVEHIKLDGSTTKLVALLQFITTWHDERKAKVLQAIDALAQALNELATRAHVDRTALDYLTVGELDSLQSINDIARLVDRLSERIDGVWSLIDETGDTPFGGRAFATVDALRATVQAKHTARTSSTAMSLSWAQ